MSAPGTDWTPSSIEINTTTGKQPRTGWRKGSFGIVEINIETKQVGWLLAASLTHLGTGWRVAAFADAKEAAIAGELAEQCADWSTLCNPSVAKSPAWDAVKNRMVELWEAAGICKRVTAENGQAIWAANSECSEARHESRS